MSFFLNKPLTDLHPKRHSIIIITVFTDNVVSYIIENPNKIITRTLSIFNIRIPIF